MKRSLFVLAVLLLSFGLASADVGFRVEFDGLVNDSGMTAGKNFTASLYMTNDDNQRNGYSIPLEFYGDDTVTTVTWVDAGVAAPEGGYMGGAMEILNQFAPGFYAGARFTSVNQVTADYDGNLPDTMNHTTATVPTPAQFPTTRGWVANEGELLVYRWHLNVNTDGWDVETGGDFCIDSIAHADVNLNWLWLPPSGPFGGPYCQHFYLPANQPPTFNNCPTTDISLQWSDQVSEDFTLTDPDDPPDPITSASATVGTATVTNATTVHWAYNPDCTDVGSHDVTVCGGDDAHPCPAGGLCQFTVTVLNTAPVIAGDCGNLYQVGITGSGTADFTATDANAGDVLTFSIESIYKDGTTETPVAAYATISGGTVTFYGDLADAGKLFDVTVRVTDCAGDFDECVVQFNVVSELEYDIVIEKVEGQLQGQYATVDVTKTEGSNDMYGFDFLISYDASALTAMGAIPGVLFDMPGDYQWEYFTYRFGPFGNCGSACPSGMIRVVGLADQNDGPNHPLDVNVDNGTVLFQLNFLVSNDRTFECQYVPIRFFWMDCGDNTIAYHSSVDNDPLAITTAVSHTVNAFSGIGTYIDITDPATGYPTFTGFQPDLCPPEANKPPWKPFANFYNGGIDIICAEDIDARGDINLNGISNEIADAVVFTNYFIYGLPAFTVNVDGQTAATDVNNDGIVLSVADLVYLIRVIVGDALPYPKLAADGQANFTLENGQIVTNAQLGAALFVFDGQVEVSAAQNGFEVKSDYVDGQTRALVYSFNQGAVISGAVLNAGEMPSSVEAVDYYGAVYNDVSLVPTTFSMSNYPNPFNPVTTIQMNIPGTEETDFTVEVFNVAGQKVATLNGRGVGTVTVDWDASNVASGIYFYRGTVNGASATAKMVLLK